MFKILNPGELADKLLRFILVLVMYPCWIIVTLAVMCNFEFHQDLTNYCSLIVAFLYLVNIKFDIPMKLTMRVSGKWSCRSARHYHCKEWEFLLINIIPLMSLLIAKGMVSIFPQVPFNSSGLTFLAILITVMTNNRYGNL